MITRVRSPRIVLGIVLLSIALAGAGCGGGGDQKESKGPTNDAIEGGYVSPEAVMQAFNDMTRAGVVDREAFAAMCYVENDAQRGLIDSATMPTIGGAATLKSVDVARAVAEYEDTGGASHDLHLVKIGERWWVSGYTVEYDKTLGGGGVGQGGADPRLNLDFEGGRGRGGLPKAWDGGAMPATGGRNYQVSVNEDVAHGGSASGCIRYTGPQTYNQDWFGTLTQGIAPDTYRGKRVRLSGFVQTDGVTHGAGLWMRIDGPAGVMAFDNMMTRPVQGTTAWRKYGVVHDVPDNATQIAFGVLLIGHGIVWADDLALEIVGDEVPTTTVVTGP